MGDLHKVYIYGRLQPTVKRSQLYLNGNSARTYMRVWTGAGYGDKGVRKGIEGAEAGVEGRKWGLRGWGVGIEGAG